MPTFLGFVAFFVAWAILVALGAPGFVALIGALGIGYFIRHLNKESRDRAEQHSEAPARSNTYASRELIENPMASQSNDLHDQVARLTQRVAVLEQRIAALVAEPSTSAKDAETEPVAMPSMSATIQQPHFSEITATILSRVDESRVGDSKVVDSSEPLPDVATKNTREELAAPVEPAASASGTESSTDVPAVEATPGESAEESTRSAQTIVNDSAAGPTWITRLLSGNVVAKAGAIILFLGVGFLLKFAYDRAVFPPEIRLLVVAIAALAAFWIGRRLLDTRRTYGLILQGAASGLAYIDVFFAQKTFGLISPTVSFGLYAVMGVITTALAVRQDARSLAVLGLLGAFISPFLAASGSGNLVALFSYYLLLNVFVFAVSWFKSWRELNLTGWFFTFAVTALTVGWRPRQEDFVIVENFLLVFFAIYLAIPILFAARQPPHLRGLVDGTLVFGTPVTAAGIQHYLVHDMPYGLAWSAGIGALIYAVLAIVVFRHRNMRLLGETYAALAVGLATMTIFFSFGAYTTFALWSIEGAAIVWVGIRQQRPLARAFGLVVQVGGAILFLLHHADYERANALFNNVTLGCAIVSAAAFITATLLRRHRTALSDTETNMPAILLIWGAMWLHAGAIDAINHGLARQHQVAAGLLFSTVALLAAEFLGARHQWPALRALTVAQPFVIVASALLSLIDHSHLLTGTGWVAWPASMAALFLTLNRQVRDTFEFGRGIRHLAAWVMLAAIATWEVGYYFVHREYFICLIIALGGFAASALRYRLHERGTGAPAYSSMALCWALAVWYLSGARFIADSLSEENSIPALLLFVAFSSVAIEWLHRLLDWPALRRATWIFWLAIPPALITSFWYNSHPFATVWSLAWPAAWLAAMALLHRADTESSEWSESHTNDSPSTHARPDTGPGLLTGYRHALIVLLPIVLASWEWLYWAHRYLLGDAWQLAGLALPFSMAAIVMQRAALQQLWPINRHGALYRELFLPALVIFLALWTLVANIHAPGPLAPLPIYLPILNPLDIAVIVAAIAAWPWMRGIESAEILRLVRISGGILAFEWLNATALRCIHFWAGVPYRLNSLLASVLAQATLSMLWTGMALLIMTFARRNADRKSWLVGAGLLAAVVAKLFLFDLANSGTVERIVSFVGVGIGLLVIGYIAPVPPGTRESESGN